MHQIGWRLQRQEQCVKYQKRIRYNITVGTYILIGNNSTRISPRRNNKKYLSPRRAKPGIRRSSQYYYYYTSPRRVRYGGRAGMPKIRLSHWSILYYIYIKSDCPRLCDYPIIYAIRVLIRGKLNERLREIVVITKTAIIIWIRILFRNPVGRLSVGGYRSEIVGEGGEGDWEGEIDDKRTDRTLFSEIYLRYGIDQNYSVGTTGL